jgi:hypothetical protein
MLPDRKQISALPRVGGPASSHCMPSDLCPSGLAETLVPGSCGGGVLLTTAGLVPVCCFGIFVCCFVWEFVWTLPQCPV